MRSACRTARASSCSRRCGRSPPRRHRRGPDSQAPQRRWPSGAIARRRQRWPRRPTHRRSATVNAGYPPIIGTGSISIPCAVVSTTNATVGPSASAVATMTSARSASATKSAIPLTRQPSLSRARPQSTASHRKHRAGSTVRWSRAPSRTPDAGNHGPSSRPEPVDSQRRMHRAVNDHGAQRASGLDAEQAESSGSAGAAVLFVDRQSEHARLGQRLPLRCPARARRPARCDTSRPDRVRPDRESLACRHRPYDGIR